LGRQRDDRQQQTKCERTHGHCQALWGLRRMYCRACPVNMKKISYSGVVSSSLRCDLEQLATSGCECMQALGRKRPFRFRDLDLSIWRSILSSALAIY
jgi:hypothetical protein